MVGRCFIQINIRAGDSVFGIVLGVFHIYKKIARPTETQTRDSRYEQFETSPETIEQELRPGVC